SKSTLYKLIREDGFPKPARVGASSAWVESEIDAWITARLQLRDQAA
ncbi:MAG: helix-turn-helix transcriptional regulator, partial [Stenotrophomonas koreensis]